MMSIDHFSSLGHAPASSVSGLDAPIWSMPPDRVNSKISRFPAKEAEEVVRRATSAVERTYVALTVLKLLGYDAWLVGSLSNAKFTVHSDVDFIVDVGRNDLHMVQLVLERIMKGLPFDLVPFESIPQDKREMFMKGALDASGLRARFGEDGRN